MAPGILGHQQAAWVHEDDYVSQLWRAAEPSVVMSSCLFFLGLDTGL